MTGVLNLDALRRATYADALLLLIRAGEIIHGQGHTARAVLGVSMADMEAARSRLDARSRADSAPATPGPSDPPPEPVSPAPGPPSSSSGAPEPYVPQPQRYHPKASRKRRTNDAGELWCTRHNDGAGAYLPLENFALRSDYRDENGELTGARRSACRDCMTAYNHRRYLSVDMTATGSAVLHFVQGEGDPDLTCARCNRTIATGEAANTIGLPMHEACPNSG